MSVATFLILALLATWLIFSIGNQFFLLGAVAKRRNYHIFAWDIFALIPYWAFWSGPSTKDCWMLYRDKLSGGCFTPWRTAWATAPSLLRFIWNPQVRKWKALDSWLPLLMSVAKGEKNINEIFLSRIYLSAATHVSGLPLNPDTESRQFVIARVCGFDRDEPAEILFVSPLFSLEKFRDQASAAV